MKLALMLLSVSLVAGCASTPSPDALNSISYKRYFDDNTAEENCLNYAIFTADEVKAPVKVCGAGRLLAIAAHDDKTFVIGELVGGNAAGWGVFRYTSGTDQTLRFEANARSVRILKWDETGVWLRLTRAVHLPNGAYGPDKIETWFWNYSLPAPMQAK